MQIYIDESGNLGTAGDFFTIACIIPHKSQARRIKKVIRKSCIKFGEGDCALLEIKTFKLSLPQKQDLLNRLCAKDDFSCSYVVAHKKHLEPKILEDKNVCYNYLLSHLLGRIVKTATEDIQVILDNHSIKVASLHSLADYIKILAYTKWGYKGKITFEYQDSKSHYALQAADVIANIVYGRYSYNKLHHYAYLEPFFTHRIQFPYKKFGT